MSSTLDKTQSQYERKLARQKQLDMMEAAASGQTYDPPRNSSPSGSIHSHGAASSMSSGMQGIPSGGGGGDTPLPPEGAIESARRFLWDEDEEEYSKGASSGGAGGGAGDAQQFLGEKQTPGSSTGAMLNRLFGGLRRGEQDPTASSVSSPLKTSNNLAPRRNSLWMSDAQPRNQEAEEYMTEKDHGRGGVGSRNQRNPLAALCYGILECLLAIFHTLVGACAILAEILAGCIASCSPRLLMFVCGGFFGIGLLVFSIVAIAHRASSSSSSSNTSTNVQPQPPSDTIQNTVRFNALRTSILESGFTSAPHLDTTGTAQNLAIRWLTDDDPGEVQVDQDSILQRYALAVFYFSTYVASEFESDRGGASPQTAWKYMDYWMSDKGICLWYGVSCPPRLHEGLEETHYNDNSDVLKLNLTDNNVRGTIPSEIVALENLESLDLGKNKLHGTIPVTLAKMKEMKELYLEENELEGTIPSELSRLGKLRDLFLGTNKLEGSIPKEIGQLTELRALGLDENFLTGKIPNIWNLKKLLILYLDSNELTGTIPYEIRSLTDMMDFRLRKNRLNGTIPETIHDMTHLELFYVDDNELTGTIPETWDLMLRVQEIQIYKNKLHGGLPDSIHELKDLKVLYADNNQLEGTIPASYGALVDLHTFYVFNNRLRGSIPTELGRMEDLRDFQAYNNNLEGPIPTELGGCYHLEKLELQSNKLEGTIPSELGRLENLEMLKLYRNSPTLSGIMPVEICNAKKEFSLGFLAADCNTDQGGKMECTCCNACYP